MKSVNRIVIVFLCLAIVRNVCVAGLEISEIPDDHHHYHHYYNTAETVPDNRSQEDDQMPSSSVSLPLTSNLPHHLWDFVQSNVKQLVTGVQSGADYLDTVLTAPITGMRQQLHFKAHNAKRLRAVPQSSNHHSIIIKPKRKPKIILLNKKFHRSKKPKNIHAPKIHETFTVEHIHVDEDGNPMPGMKNSKKIIKEPLKSHGDKMLHQFKSAKDAALKELEEREEQKVEQSVHYSPATSSYGASSDAKYDSGWTPIQPPTTEKPKPASKLHTSVMQEPIAKQVHHETHVFDVKFEKPQHDYSSYKDQHIFEDSASKESQTVMTRVRSDHKFPSHIQSLTTTSSTRRPPRQLHKSRLQTEETQMMSAVVGSAVENVTVRSVPKKKHQNLVAKTLNRGQIKFGNSSNL